MPRWMGLRRSDGGRRYPVPGGLQSWPSTAIVGRATWYAMVPALCCRHQACRAAQSGAKVLCHQLGPFPPHPVRRPRRSGGAPPVYAERAGSLYSGDSQPDGGRYFRKSDPKRSGCRPAGGLVCPRPAPSTTQPGKPSMTSSPALRLPPGGILPCSPTPPPFRGMAAPEAALRPQAP